MLAINRVYNKEDLSRKGIEYYSGGMLPDIGVALTSAYYFLAGFEGIEATLNKDGLRRIGVKNVDDQFVNKMINRSARHFKKVSPSEVLDANNTELNATQGTELYYQLLNEGFSKYWASKIISDEREARRESRERR